MNKIIFAFARIMFLIWITTACVMGVVLDREVIYMITMIAYLYCFIVSEVRATALEKRLEKYKKAYSKLAKKYEDNESEE